MAKTKVQLQELVIIANKGYKAIEELWGKYQEEIEFSSDSYEWELLTEQLPPDTNRELRLKRGNKRKRNV
jgi:hypothetical protein